MLNLVTVRARTRGKSPVEFTYQGVGKLTPRIVKDEKGNPVKVDGKEVTVDDIDATNLTDQFQDVIDLYASVGNANPLQAALDGSLDWFNHLQRKAAAPVSEAAPDELSPVVAALIEAGILDEEKAGVWRRTVTMAANQIEEERIDYVRRTKEVKKLRNDKPDVYQELFPAA